MQIKHSKVYSYLLYYILIFDDYYNEFIKIVTTIIDAKKLAYSLEAG